MNLQPGMWHSSIIFFSPMPLYLAASYTVNVSFSHKGTLFVLSSFLFVLLSFKANYSLLFGDTIYKCRTCYKSNDQTACRLPKRGRERTEHIYKRQSCSIHHYHHLLLNLRKRSQAIHVKATTINITATTRAEIHMGENTHNHDHESFPIILAITNMIVRTLTNVPEPIVTLIS